MDPQKSPSPPAHPQPAQRWQVAGGGGTLKQTRNRPHSPVPRFVEVVILRDIKVTMDECIRFMSLLNLIRAPQTVSPGL
ncbi:hypothetical protein XELAEV_18019018mg [Xenopus laevis]|uniref:Uncharacterized protein n=1 Tax=Xenopus laevis TaxID=8355 RepID=A0A974HUH0_XENLA|nr:hypothetical protein XELAEV_18019018mg [Xenopus laevis]